MITLSVFEKLFGTLLKSNKSNNEGEESRNAAITIEGNSNDVDVAQQDIKDAMKNETVSSSSDHEIIEDLKKEILTSSDLGIVEMAEKAKTIARLNSDKEELEWLESELTGFDEDEKRSDEELEHRQVKAGLNLAIRGGPGQTVDLRDEDYELILGSNLVELEKGIEKEDATHMTFQAQIPPRLEELMAEEKAELVNVRGKDEGVEYLIPLEEIEDLVKQLRAKIRDYVSQVSTSL